MSGFILHTLTLIVTTVLLLDTLPAAQCDNDFIIQLLVTVDAKGVEKWKQFTGKTEEARLKKELESYVLEANEVYKSLAKIDNTLSIQFEQPEIDLLSYNILYSREGIVDAEYSKRYFANHLRNNQKTFDIAVLFTGYDLASRGSTETAGHANLGSVCKSNGVLIVELTGRYIDPLVMAHEIGHVLSAHHDGYKTSAACPASDYYVMTPALLLEEPNKYFFSRCSYDSFYKLLVDDVRGEECLSDGDKNNIVTGTRLGQIVSPDSACQRRYGSKSRVDREWYAKKGYDVNFCLRIRCDTYVNDPSDTTLPWVTTHQGMNCAKGRQCLQGQCRSISGADNSVLPTCPFGDQNTDVFKGRNCTSLKYEDCYNFQVECCNTCSKFKDTAADKECRHLSGPSSSLVRDRYRKWGDEVCQKLYCATGFGQEWRYETFDTPDGLDCGKNKKCKNKKCVTVASGGNSRMPDSCPFGDQPWIPTYHRTCAQQTDYYGCVEHRWAPMCCHTCAKTFQ